jgi:hypothetical protein
MAFFLAKFVNYHFSLSYLAENIRLGTHCRPLLEQAPRGRYVANWTGFASTSRLDAIELAHASVQRVPDHVPPKNAEQLPPAARL